MYFDKLNIRKAITFFWFTTCFSYFFQFPIRKLSIFIVPSLAVFILLYHIDEKIIKADGKWLSKFLIYFIYIVIMGATSILNDVSISRVIRFLLILTLIPIFSIAKFDDFKTENNIFVTLSVIKSCLLIFVALAVLVYGTYEPFREWAYANDFGDIYVHPVLHLPRVQVHGNGILPFSYMLNDINNDGKHKKIYSLILLLGIIAAGNSAFLLGIALYYFYKLISYIFKKKHFSIKKNFFVYLLLFFAISFGIFGIAVMIFKAGFSNAIRAEQAQVLLNNSGLFGNGLGSYISSSGIRDYDGNIIFEMQTLYILNQIGVLGLFMFYSLILFNVYKYSKKAFIIFLIYLIYTFWNPYCFDSTEMMVITLLMNYNRVSGEKDYE